MDDVFPSGTPDRDNSVHSFTPSFAVSESHGTVRLQLRRVTHGEGTSLQEAADDLVRRLLALAMTVREHGARSSCDLPRDSDAVSFVHELGEIAAGGGDIRERLFGG